MSQERDDQSSRVEERLASLPELRPSLEARARLLDALEHEARGREAPEEALRVLPRLTPPRSLDKRVAFLVRTAGSVSAAVRSVSPRTAVVLVAAACLVLVLGVWPSLRRLEPVVTGGGEAGSAGGQVTRAVAPMLHVRALEGVAELRRGGVVSPLLVGAPLERGDTIVAGAEGRVVLGIDDVAEVTLDVASALDVELLSRSVVQLELTRGRVQGLRRAGSGDLRLNLSQGEVQLTVLHGHVGLLRAGEGRAALAALGTESAVELAGRRLTIPAYHVVSLEAGVSRPLVPTAAPTELALTLRQVATLRPGDRELTLEGRVSPGTILILNAREIPVSPRGEFVARLPAAGVAEVSASVRDALGRSLARKLTVARVSQTVPWKEPG